MKRLLLGIAFVNFAVSADADDLARTTWQYPSHEVVQQLIDDWLAEANVDQAIAGQIRQQWQEPVDPDQRLSVFASSLELLGGELSDLVRRTRTARFDKALPDVACLDDSSQPDFLRNHAKLVYARWLVQNQLYNETLEQLASITTEDVIDPASLLFFQSIANHRLLKKDECLPIVARLLEQEEALPRRFAILANMIRDDIKPLEADSLDEISRLMDNIQVRLGHGRAGKRVRTEEHDVIAKLDKMIKKLEEEAKKQSSSAAGNASGKPGENLNPNKPMEDSIPGGGKGPGNVDAKDIGDAQGWGNLPPKERQQALQQVGKDFPSHYRDVIEAYFRKLAQEGSDEP